MALNKIDAVALTNAAIERERASFQSALSDLAVRINSIGTVRAA